MDFWFKQSGAMRRMIKAREKVAKTNPFFASLLFMARLIESKKVNSIVTDGSNVLFNKEFVENPDNETFIEGILLECILHCALTHKARQQYRDDQIWNDATGFSVGSIVKDYFPINPEYTKIDKRFQQKTAEGIYEILEQEKQKQSKGKNQDGDGDGDGQPQERPGGMTPQQGKGNQDGDDDQDGDGEGQEQDQEDQEREWRRALGNAVEKSQKAGTLPGNIQRLVDELMPKDKLDWRDLIRDMSRDAKAKTSRTWSRPNRRREDYMPGYGQDMVFELIVAFDVSGSVSDEMFREMKSEVANALDQDIVNSIRLVAVDTQIHGEVVVRSADEIREWKPRGGGGTDFSSAMEHLGKIPDAVGMLFLTDMQTSSFGPQPSFPVVWVNWLKDGVKAPYGRTVEY